MSSLKHDGRSVTLLITDLVDLPGLNLGFLFGGGESDCFLFLGGGGGANKVRAAIWLKGEGSEGRCAPPEGSAEAKFFFKIQKVYESKLK